MGSAWRALLGPNDTGHSRIPKKPRCQMVGQAVTCALASPDCSRPITQATSGLPCCLSYMLRRHAEGDLRTEVQPWESRGRGQLAGHQALVEHRVPGAVLDSGLWGHRCVLTGRRLTLRSGRGALPCSPGAAECPVLDTGLTGPPGVWLG